MDHKLIEVVERRYCKEQLPEFHIGDTVNVHTRIREGGKERIQMFNGVVIARRGRGVSETFTCRRIVNNEGVERTFMLHSPLITNIEVKRRGKVRRAKLFFLRNRVGKARRLRELRISRKKNTQEPADQPVTSTEADAKTTATAAQPVASP